MWIWLDQLLAAHGRDGAFYGGKRQAARWFYCWELPTVLPMLDTLTRADDTVSAMNPDWF